MATPRKPHGGGGKMNLGFLAGIGGGAGQGGNYEMAGTPAGSEFDEAGTGNPDAPAGNSQATLRAVDKRNWLDKLLGRTNTAGEINKTLDINQGLNAQNFPNQVALQKLGNQGQLDVHSADNAAQLALKQKEIEATRALEDVRHTHALQQQGVSTADAIKIVQAKRDAEKDVANNATSTGVLGRMGILDTPGNRQSYDSSVVPGIISGQAGNVNMASKFANDPSTYNSFAAGKTAENYAPVGALFKNSAVSVPEGGLVYEPSGIPGLSPSPSPIRGMIPQQSMTSFGTGPVKDPKTGQMTLGQVPKTTESRTAVMPPMSIPVAQPNPNPPQPTGGMVPGVGNAGLYNNNTNVPTANVVTPASNPSYKPTTIPGVQQPQDVMNAFGGPNPGAFNPMELIRLFMKYSGSQGGIPQ